MQLCKTFTIELIVPPQYRHKRGTIFQGRPVTFEDFGVNQTQILSLPHFQKWYQSNKPSVYTRKPADELNFCTAVKE